jgi:mitochondrial fission protein ELM1
MSKVSRVVWVVSDGVAGHFNQSKGVLHALALRQDLNVEWLELRLRSGLLRRVLRYWLNAWDGRLSMLALSGCYRGLHAHPTTRPDLIVGAGGKSMYAVVALAKHYQAQAVFVGSLRGLRPDLFHAVLVLERHPEPQYITLETAPMPVDAIQQQQAADQWQHAHPDQTGELWAMLIGGDGAGAVYQPQDWHTLAAQMNQLAADRGIRWLVTTSRRTGLTAEKTLQQVLNPQYLADAVWWAQQPKPVMQAFLGRAKVVCCTAESLSMLTEAIVAQRPVLALTPQHFEPDSRYEAALHRLINRRRMALCPFSALATTADQVDQLDVLQQDMQQLLAERLKSLF